MARNILSTRVARKSQLTPTIIELNMKMIEPSSLMFKAGQFMMMNLPLKDGQKRPTLRAYSIASDANDSSSFKLIIKYVASGVGSEYIKSLNEGDTVSFTGPFGKLLFLEPPTSQVLLVSTGAGISQHTSYLLTHGSKYPNTVFKMLVGVWNEHEVFYQKELDFIKSRLRNFEYQFVIDRPSSSWKGLSGFVTHHLSLFDYKNIDTTFYLCGNPAMIDSVTAKLKSEGVNPEQILAEAFS
ncbi:MAG: hypothetical protein A4S09_01000 [Proteobacteria bacterium SG_bin7]|nr:MAG: hypothetical protein A4S09_01000 [Proteobacteria bacterium SG_bin7]